MWKLESVYLRTAAKLRLWRFCVLMSNPDAVERVFVFTAGEVKQSVTVKWCCAVFATSMC